MSYRDKIQDMWYESEEYTAKDSKKIAVGEIIVYYMELDKDPTIPWTLKYSLIMGLQREYNMTFDFQSEKPND